LDERLENRTFIQRATADFEVYERPVTVEISPVRAD
jgi:hypothetical protein